ncbi:MAG TPA: hypothetical protein VF715_01760 [Thermoleophilaceae bacterium]
MRVALATCAPMPGGNPDDRPVAELVGARWEIWDDPSVDWASYDRVVLRSVWDYTGRADEFLTWCRAVGPERLRNHPELVAFNSDKCYLESLSAPTVPTQFVEPGAPAPELSGEVVVKPTVSAGARSTGRFRPEAHSGARALIEEITAGGRTAMIQPFLEDVEARGEVALVHFGGELSHTLLKRSVLAPDEVAPIAEQNPLGMAAAMLEDGLVTAGEASPAETALARSVLEEVAARFGGMPLYARVDLVRDAGGRPVLLELEAVEPHLYLATSAGAAERFARAIAEAR